MTTILDLLDDAAASPSWLMFRPQSKERVLFVDLWQRGVVAADWLSQRTRTGEVIVMHLTANPDCLAGLIGAWRAGLTVASLPDPSRMAVQEFGDLVRRVCGDLRPRLGLLSQAAIDQVPPTAGLSLFPYQAVSGSAPRGRREDVGQFIQFTSGSTRDPAGVMLSLDAIASNTRAISDRVLSTMKPPIVCSWLPLSHDMGLFGGLLSPLVAAAGDGRRWGTCLIDTAAFARRPPVWLKTCAEIGASITLTSPTALAVVARLRRPHGELDLSGLESCVVGAEPVSPAGLDTFVDSFASAGLGSDTVRPAYGLAENTLAVTIAAAGSPFTRRSLASAAAMTAGEPAVEIVSCGAPTPGTEVTIVHGSDTSTIGEIAIRGTSLFSGYSGRRVPRMDGDWFLTGDAGALLDGELFVIGRLDDKIIIRGLNLNTIDLEAVVSDIAPALSRGVAAVPDDSGYALILEVHSLEMFARVAADVRAECVRRFSIAPTRLVAVYRHSLPRTTSGKLRRAEIRKRLALEELNVVGERT